MTTRRRLNLHRMRRYPIRKGPQERVLAREQWLDADYTRRLMDRIASAHPNQRVEMTAEQSGRDFIERRYVLRWWVRPATPVHFVAEHIYHSEYPRPASFVPPEDFAPGARRATLNPCTPHH